MADIETGIQGLLQSMQQPAVNPDITEALQNQQVQQGNIALQIAQQQQAAQQNILKLRSQALGSVLNTPITDPQYSNKLAQLNVIAPDLNASIKDNYNMMTTDAQKQHDLDMSSMYGYTSNGDWDNAIQHQQSIIDADQTAGRDTTQDRQYLNILQQASKGDKAAQTQAVNMPFITLAALHPDQYSNILQTPSNINKNNAQAGLEGAQSVEALANANKANAEAIPNGVPVTTNSGETVLVNPKTGQQLSNVDQQSQGITASNSADAALHAFMGTEFNPNGPVDQQPRLANGQPASSAKGPSQAIDSTWIQSLAENHPEMFKGMSQKQIDNIANNGQAAEAFSKTALGKQLVAQKTNVQLANETASNINKSNIQTLATQYNIPPTYATAAMAYKLGPDGAAKVIKSPDATPLSKILSPAALKANPSIANLNVGQYEQLIHAQIAKGGNDPNTPISINDQNATGQTLLQSLPTGLQAQIKAILNGDEQPPSQRGDTSPKGMYMEGLLTRIDPSYTNNRYQLKQDLYDSSKPESTGSQIHALNNLIGHTYDYAIHSIERNGSSGALGNAIGNMAAAAFNNSGATNQLTNKMNSDRAQIVGEANKLYGENTELATKIGEKKLHISDDTATQLSNANELAQLAKTKLSNMMQQFSQGTRLPANLNDFLTPANQVKLQHLEQLASQQSNKPNQQAVALLQAHAFDKVPGTNQTYAQKFEQTYGIGSAAQYIH